MTASVMAKNYWMKPYHNGVVGSRDECNEEGQHHVDEEGDKGVEVDLAEDPHQRAAVLHLSKRYKHVVPVDQRKQALWHHGQGAKLYTWGEGSAKEQQHNTH